MPELKTSDSLAVLVGIWRQENVSKREENTTAYFTGLTSGDRGYCSRANTTVISVAQI